ncbi:hypothetical protein JCM10003_1328 [Bacteroides pyogenes JCM 10003]|nr:hypothetical protein JCM10003_1328 [Bacteroides pyogenes JCM 10003]
MPLSTVGLRRSFKNKVRLIIAYRTCLHSRVKERAYRHSLHRISVGIPREMRQIPGFIIRICQWRCRNPVIEPETTSM